MGQPTLGSDAEHVAWKLAALGYSDEVTDAVAAGPDWARVEALAEQHPLRVRQLAHDLDDAKLWSTTVRLFVNLPAVADELRRYAAAGQKPFRG